jgi:hypothetical protein
MKRNILFYIIAIITLQSYSQARINLNNGGLINITNGAFLVIDNPNPNAITRTTSGHIISEGQFNRVKWNIGTTAGTYVIPFGIGTSTYLPVTLSASGASGATGSLIFSMYPVGSWLNSSNLPTGVTNFINNYGGDNSMYAIDRFWRIQPDGYVTRPALSNFVLTYVDIEHSVASNNIIESNLIAQRYNDIQNSWDDYMPGTVINTGDSTATVGFLPSNELYTWWTLVDNRFILPIELTSFSANCKDGNVVISWETASEKNNDYYVVERSADDITFSPVQQVRSQDPNSLAPLFYSIKDTLPLNVKSYYRLKQVDKDGQFTYSSVVVVDCKGGEISFPQVSIYPNPASNILTMDIKGIKGNRSWMIYDVTGKLMNEALIENENENVRESIDVAGYAKAPYVLRLDVNNELFQIIKFVKN